MKKLLFVCTGNTCRSSMAEGIFNHKIKKHKTHSKDYISNSSGIMAYSGDNAAFHSIKVLKDKWNIDISNHRSRKLNNYILDESFLVFTMTNNHKQSILINYPQYKEKIYTLKEFVTSNNLEDPFSCYDIKDPYGGSIDIYLECACEIYSNIKLLIKKLDSIDF